MKYLHKIQNAINLFLTWKVARTYQNLSNNISSAIVNSYHWFCCSGDSHKLLPIPDHGNGTSVRCTTHKHVLQAFIHRPVHVVEIKFPEKVWCFDKLINIALTSYKWRPNLHKKYFSLLSVFFPQCYLHSDRKGYSWSSLLDLPVIGIQLEPICSQ